jgi:hypothetical protein
MTTISKRDALQLAQDIRHANIAGHAIAERTNGGPDAATYGFLGGLESVLRHFIATHAGSEAAAALVAAMTYTPTPEDIAARNAKLDSYRTAATRSAS